VRISIKQQHFFRFDADIGVLAKTFNLANVTDYRVLQLNCKLFADVAFLSVFVCIIKYKLMFDST